MKIGVEIGGTFTDIIVHNGHDDVKTMKVLSTPDQPQIGALNGLRQIGNIDQIDTLVHASTVGTNAIIERRGTRVGLIVTEGFGDILQIQRHERTRIYEARYRKPEPLIPRDRVVEVPERLDADGKIVVPLDLDAAREAVRTLVEVKQVESIAVCLLHSYKNAQHEQAIADLLYEEFPSCYVLLSSDVLPEIREYERASTTVIAATLIPILKRYVDSMKEELRTEGFTGDFHFMQSNGGILPAGQTHSHAVRTLNSGPAAGVTGALNIVRQLELRNAVTLDMGGTSADVCLIHDGEAEVTTDTKVSGLPVAVPMTDVVSIGAGGGSIAWIDDGRILRVGPHSAGADPGPICYGLGGNEPTVTDANVVLGLIRRTKFHGGKMALDLEGAVQALRDLGAELGGDERHVADSIRRVVNASMLQAIRLVSVERGFDPREFFLIAFGGAGPLHAAEVANELGMLGVLVPRFPGLLSAYGLLVADFQRDYVQSQLTKLSEVEDGEIEHIFGRLKDQARKEFAHVGGDDIRLQRALDMRYTGQAFELTIPLETCAQESGGRSGLQAAFHATHLQRYGYAIKDRPVDIVNYRLTATVPAGSQLPAPTATPSHAGGASNDEQHEIYFNGERHACRFLARDNLAPGSQLDGPAVIEEPTSTTFVPAGWMADVDSLGIIWLKEQTSDGR